MVKFTGMQPVLAVSALSEELDYYRERLGFAIGWKWGEPIVRAGVERDGLEVQLVSDGRFSPEGPSRVYFLVQGVDAYYAECRKRGARIHLPLENRSSFGMRDFRVIDRSGNILAFGEPLPEAAGTDDG